MPMSHHQEDQEEGMNRPCAALYSGLLSLLQIFNDRGYSYSLQWPSYRTGLASVTRFKFSSRILDSFTQRTLPSIMRSLIVKKQNSCATILGLCGAMPVFLIFYPEASCAISVSCRGFLVKDLSRNMQEYENSPDGLYSLSYDTSQVPSAQLPST